MSNSSLLGRWANPMTIYPTSIDPAQVIPFMIPAVAMLLTYFPMDYSSGMGSRIVKDWQREYDFIVVGGGTAGATLAARLSEASAFQVLLIEAGHAESFYSSVPIAAAFQSRSDMDWGYSSEPQVSGANGLIDRRVPLPSGKSLGGTSAINSMLYQRGNQRDYEAWEKELKNQTWTFDHVLHYFMKSENNLDDDIYFKHASNHGRGGPLSVARSPHRTPLARAFIDAAQSLGYPRNEDPNGPSQVGFQAPQGMLRGGMRCSSARAFLNVAKGRLNLDILVGTQVIRILFDEKKRAVGVVMERGGKKFVVMARKEVIVTAGAYKSPQLLMLSGVGSRSHLMQVGLTVVADVPGVGSNLQDHVSIGGVVFSVNRGNSHHYNQLFNVPNAWGLLVRGTGAMTSPASIEATGFLVSPSRKNKTNTVNWPDIELRLVAGSPVSDGGRWIWRKLRIQPDIWTEAWAPHAKLETFTIEPIVLKPKARGYVLLTSASPHDPPKINPRYLTDPKDLRTAVDAIKTAYQLAETPEFQKLGAKPLDASPRCTKEHGFKIGGYFECLAQEYTFSALNPVGTCKMGPLTDPMTVVDEHFVVRGVTGLRVCDGSIMPKIIAGDTTAAIIMIADRCADFIKESHIH